MANRKIAKKKVEKNFFSMYQSSFFMLGYRGKDKGWEEVMLVKGVKGR